MSSGGWGRVESAEAREARLKRAALLGWENACAERHALGLRVRHESTIRGALDVDVPVAARDGVSGLTAAEIAARTAALTAQTHVLSGQVASAIERRAQANADAHTRALLRDIGGAPDGGRAWVRPEQTAEAPVAAADTGATTSAPADIAAAEEVIRRELARAASAGVDLAEFADVIADIHAAPTDAHALFETGRLRNDVEAAIARQSHAEQERREQERELNRISAAFELAAPDADLPRSDLDAAREQVARGEPVPPPLLARLSAVANALEDDALAQLRALNTRTSHQILVDAFAERGYRPLPLMETLVVEDGELVSRGTESLLGLADEPDHALRLRLHDGALELQEVRLTEGGGPVNKAADRRFELRMCSDIEEIKREADALGVELELTLLTVSIPTIATTATTATTLTRKGAGRPAIATTKPKTTRQTQRRDR